eukprot:TRINITY_DN10893_c0_g1_i2.p1 TRINITY_DN10893_c0_g1~~TRINITY_DN10893_c0_g1_i2.p1  ORF type:complete len:537 (-),score=44.55 TRINITY_DN10893_c0_g1_i2:211-1821(-)
MAFDPTIVIGEGGLFTAAGYVLSAFYTSIGFNPLVFVKAPDSAMPVCPIPGGTPIAPPANLRELGTCAAHITSLTASCTIILIGHGTVSGVLVLSPGSTSPNDYLDAQPFAQVSTNALKMVVASCCGTSFCNALITKYDAQGLMTNASYYLCAFTSVALMVKHQPALPYFALALLHGADNVPLLKKLYYIRRGPNTYSNGDHEQGWFAFATQDDLSPGPNLGWPVGSAAAWVQPILTAAELQAIVDGAVAARGAGDKDLGAADEWHDYLEQDEDSLLLPIVQKRLANLVQRNSVWQKAVAKPVTPNVAATADMAGLHAALARLCHGGFDRICWRHCIFAGPLAWVGADCSAVNHAITYILLDELIAVAALHPWLPTTPEALAQLPYLVHCLVYIHILLVELDLIKHMPVLRDRDAPLTFSAGIIPNTDIKARWPHYSAQGSPAHCAAFASFMGPMQDLYPHLPQMYLLVTATYIQEFVSAQGVCVCPETDVYLVSSLCQYGAVGHSEGQASSSRLGIQLARCFQSHLGFWYRRTTP